MEDLLRPLTTKSVAAPRTDASQIVEIKPTRGLMSNQASNVTTADEALEMLKSKPDYDSFISVLKYLDPVYHASRGFDIRLPSPKAAQLINLLTVDLAQNYWNIIDQSEEDGALESSLQRFVPKTSFLRCLKSISGIGAIVSRLRVLNTLTKDQQKIGQAELAKSIRDLLMILSEILRGDHVVYSLWTDIQTSENDSTRRTVLWKEAVSLLSSSKVLSITAESTDIVKHLGHPLDQEIYLFKGQIYSKWLGGNIAAMAQLLDEDEQGWSALELVIRRSLSLGYTNIIVSQIIEDLLLRESPLWVPSRKLIEKLHTHEKRTFISAVLENLSRHEAFRSSPLVNERGWEENEKEVGGAAALIQGLLSDNDSLKEIVAQWLVKVFIGDRISISRAALAAISSDEEKVQTVLERSMELFGDNLFITHAPIIHQEANAQILLLAAGYIHRSYPMYLFTLARSSGQLHAISNRLAASSERVRLLGMAVGVAISELVDKPDTKLKFDIQELDDPYFKGLRSLIHVEDKVGVIQDLQSGRSTPPSKVHTARAVKLKPKHSSAIRVVQDASESLQPKQEDLDIEAFAPLTKPDSDPEDEEDDPTLVQRNKPHAPVYIRDLIDGLRATEEYDRHRLALSTAASLIRRKATFGTEVADHIEELATLLIGVHDKYDLEGFQKLRLQAMIAVIVARPLQMGQWFAKTFFDGDYSLGQRYSILTALGLSARELAGHKDEDSDHTGTLSSAKETFPSKMLTAHLHKMYTSDPSPIDEISKQLEQTMIEPMALQAADKLSGPNALKVRTFSSRLEVEKRKKKPTPNALAKIVSRGFFFPLTGRWSLYTQAYGRDNIHFQSFLLSAFLKTLSLILDASGSSTVDLPEMTAEFWDLLLAVRSQGLTDSSVLEALLFAFLTLLELNENKRLLVDTFSKQLLETQDWVHQVFERTPGGDEEGDRIRMLAASVLTRTNDIVKEYQRLLMGEMFNY